MAISGMSSVPWLPQLALCCLAPFLSWSIDGAAGQPVVHGELGGVVTFICTPDPDKTIYMLFFQKTSPKTVFLNGYHPGNLAAAPEYSQRTHVNIPESSMDMWGIRVSDEAEYECLIVYDDHSEDRTRVLLSVTANYSKPVMSVSHGCGTSNQGDADQGSGDGKQGNNWDCIVRCSSHGGYPGRAVEWTRTPPLNQTIMTVNSSQDRDPLSQLVHSSSTLTFNCTSGLQVLSCSVGGATSLVTTVCKGQTKRDDVFDHWLFLALIVIALVVVLTVIMLIVKLPRAQRERVASKPEELEEFSTKSA